MDQVSPWIISSLVDTARARVAAKRGGRARRVNHSTAINLDAWLTRELKPSRVPSQKSQRSHGEG